MNIKQKVGLVASLLGIFLIVFALQSRGRISEAKSTVHSVSSRISNSSIGKMASGQMERTVSQYDTKVMLCLIGGIILLVAGAGGAYYYRKHR